MVRPPATPKPYQAFYQQTLWLVEHHPTLLVQQDVVHPVLRDIGNSCLYQLLNFIMVPQKLHKRFQCNSKQVHRLENMLNRDERLQSNRIWTQRSTHYSKQVPCIEYFEVMTLHYISPKYSLQGCSSEYPLT